MAGRSTTTSCGHARLCACQGATKRCSRCQRWFPKDEAHFYVKGNGYLSSHCQDCSRSSALAWRHDNLDRARESASDWYRANAVRARDNRLAWRSDHPERDRETRARYEAAHPTRHKARRSKLTPKEKAEVAAQKKEWRQRTRETTRLVEIRNAEKRRARLAGVEHVDIDRLVVFERDGGVCQICLEPVDLAIPWPDPGFASIDHVVTIRDGGPDTLTNVRLAHLRCNQARPRTRRQATGA